MADDEIEILPVPIINIDLWDLVQGADLVVKEMMTVEELRARYPDSPGPL